jgi:putative oxidoreductase
MKIKELFTVPEHSPSGDVALLVVRVLPGLAFMAHGWPKIQNPFGWQGANAFAPPIFQALAAVSEFGGGLAWTLGLLTPAACLGILSTMCVAFYHHTFRKGDPLIANGGASSELSRAYFSIALVLLAVGPGKFSIDRKLFGRRS